MAAATRELSRLVRTLRTLGLTANGLTVNPANGPFGILDVSVYYLRSNDPADLARLAEKLGLPDPERRDGDLAERPGRGRVRVVFWESATPYDAITFAEDGQASGPRYRCWLSLDEPAPAELEESPRG